MRIWWSKKKLRGGKICNRYSAHTPFFPTFTLCCPPPPSIWFDPVNFALNQNHCLWLAASLISTLSAPPSKMKRQFSHQRATVILLLMMLSPLLSSPLSQFSHKSTCSSLLKFLIYYLSGAMSFKDDTATALEKTALAKTKPFTMCQHGNVWADTGREVQFVRQSSPKYSECFRNNWFAQINPEFMGKKLDQ